MTKDELLEDLVELNPEALTADGFEDAIVGYSVSTIRPHVVIYDAEKCIEILMKRDGMSYEEADVGENTPLFVRMVK